jgi:DNA-binding transcriptional MerR regulator
MVEHGLREASPMRMTIGTFAAYGRVSVRTLRHYDEIGLLHPAAVDPRTGYRSYERAQLERLHGIVALKDLGFTLDQVATLLDEAVSVEQLRGMLRMRRAELEREIAEHQHRLALVERRLRDIEEEHSMTDHVIEQKSVAAMHVAEVTALADSFDPDDITPVIVPLYPQLFERLGRANVSPTGVSIAYYTDDAAGTGKVCIHAAVPVDHAVSHVDGLVVTDLPALELVASTTVHGSPEVYDSAYQALLRYAEAHGYHAVGYSREIYLDCPSDQAKWVTELQFALEAI